MRNVRSRNFFAWCLSGCLAGFALVASAQTPDPGQNPSSNTPVAIPADALAQPQPGVQPPPPDVQIQPPPSSSAWDRWGIQKVSDDDDWVRHFRVGALVGLNISANFSMKGPFNLSGNNAASGIYDDGYVRTDDTGNAGGQTGFWGYDNASQLSGQNLTMHSTTSFDATSNSKDSGTFAGFDMAYGGMLWDWGKTRIGWDLGFGLLPIKITDTSSMSASVNQTVYVFNTGPIVVPQAPYQGGPSGVGEPTITNTPASVITNNIAETVTGTHTLDVMLYTVRLGPSLYWDLNQYLGLAAGAGPAVGIVSGNLSFDETIGTVRNRGRIDGTDVVYGGYANATLLWHLEQNGDLYVGVQYMSLGNAGISGGGRSAQLNLGGQVYITAGINWPF